MPSPPKQINKQNPKSLRREYMEYVLIFFEKSNIWLSKFFGFPKNVHTQKDIELIVHLQEPPISNEYGKNICTG